jgi:cell division protein FtsL
MKIIRNKKMLGIIILWIFIILGISFITYEIVATKKENEKLRTQITQLEKENNDIQYNNWYLMEENSRINMINQDMWELYYSMVSQYDGEYEYYE